jgi:hypothetical protein
MVIILINTKEWVEEIVWWVPEAAPEKSCDLEE